MEPQKIRSTYKCTLTVLSPIHIGSGERYKKGLDFIVKGQKVYIVSKDRLIKKALEKGQKGLDKLTEAIEQSGLEEWLAGNNISPQQISRFSYGIIERYVNEIHVQIRNGTGKPLIPGSSVKGAFRTALLFDIARRDGRKTVKNAVRNLIKIRDVNLKFADQAITARFLGKDPKYSLMRSLAVADFHISDDSNMSLPVAYVYSLRNGHMQRRQIRVNQNRFDMKLFPEVIPEGSRAEGQISFDDYLIKKAAGKEKFTSFDNVNLSLFYLIKAVKKKTAATIDKEIDFLSSHSGNNRDVLSALDFYQNLRKKHENLAENEVIFQMAWGSGWRSMTGPLLEDNDLTKQVRQKLKLASHRLNAPFPKSRKIAVGTNGAMPLGWVKIIFEDKEKIKKRERLELELKKEIKKYPWKDKIQDLLKTQNLFVFRKKILKDQDALKWLDEVTEFEQAIKNHLIQTLLSEQTINSWGELKQAVLNNDLLQRWQSDQKIAQKVKQLAKNIAKTKKKKWNTDRQKEVEKWLEDSGVTWDDN